MLDAATARQLQSLGYVTAGGVAASGGEVFEVDGVDPVDLREDVKLFRDASAQLRLGNGQPARAVFRELALRHPDSAGVQEGLVNALLLLDREDELVVALTRRWFDPEDPPYQQRLIDLYQKRGDGPGAKRALAAFLARWPCDVVRRMQLANHAAQAGDTGQRVRLLAEGVADCDAPVELRNDLAWVLATTADPELRTGPGPSSWPREWSRASTPHPLVLDTLARRPTRPTASFDEAVAVVRRAVQGSAEPALPAAAQGELRDDLASFEAGPPIVE